MRRQFLLFAVVAAMGASGCSSSSPNNNTVTDSGTATDAPVTTGDVSTTGQDGASTSGSLAGGHCTMDSQCGSTGVLMCDTTQPGGWCSASCTATTTAAAQTACGGAGSQCVIDGLGTTMSQGFCTNACTPGASTLATGACPAGYVCTGFWFDSMTLVPSATGCIPFCTEDSQCGAAGAHCNVRSGECGASPYNSTGLPDGSPCDPTVTVMLPGNTMPVNNQCRGQCGQDTDNPHQGICQSFVNLKVSTTCPDNPSAEEPLHPSTSSGTPTDDFAICANATCTTSASCTAPLQCVPVQGSTTVMICDYPSTGDGGTGDAG